MYPLESVPYQRFDPEYSRLVEAMKDNYSHFQPLLAPVLQSVILHRCDIILRMSQQHVIIYYARSAPTKTTDKVFHAMNPLSTSTKQVGISAQHC